MSRANEHVHPYEVVKHYYGGETDSQVVNGITLREYFAKAAMQGLRAGESGDERWMSKGLAAQAVEDADALIAELAKPIETPLDTNGNPVQP